MSNMAELPKFQQVQYAFTAAIRQPDRQALPPGVDAERMKVYRSLFYNNVEKLLANSYQMLHKILPEARWHQLISDYFLRHQAITPLFPQMPQEFLRYLEQSYQPQMNDPPFLYELAHYEWVEIAAGIDSRVIDWQDIDKDGDLLQNLPVVNPVLYPLAYHYPVHRFNVDDLPNELPAEMTYLLIYRNSQHKVKFLHLNPVSARLLEKLLKNIDKSGEMLLIEIAEELQHPQPGHLISAGHEILQTWRQREIILGINA